MKQSDDFALRAFALVASLDCHECLFWRRESDGWFLGITCNDVFGWGCSDVEPIQTDDDLSALKRAFDDSAVYGDMLYCARRRGVRPQGAMYPEDREIWPLLDACGPYRTVGIGNPYDRAMEAKV